MDENKTRNHQGQIIGREYVQFFLSRDKCRIEGDMRAIVYGFCRIKPGADPGGGGPGGPGPQTS